MLLLQWVNYLVFAAGAALLSIGGYAWEHPRDYSPRFTKVVLLIGASLAGGSTLVYVLVPGMN